ncbi:peptidoglycan-binding protein LysM [Flavobacteriaceae bacterium]|nr:peptidoglycan-binding protein LysM [Flavobacteriaceae bacterium]
MKTFKTNIIISLIVLFFNSSFYKPATKKSAVNSSDNLEFTVLNKKTLKLAENFIFLKKDFNGFKEKLAFRESGGRYHCINKFGYIGKYQFNLSTLKMFKIYNGKKFLNNPELQEKVFLMNMQRNKWILRKDINWFVGSVINGLEITESGILAAAHLSGPGNVKKFLRGNGKADLKDAFGTSISNYLNYFKNFDMSFVEGIKKPRIQFD